MADLSRQSWGEDKTFLPFVRRAVVIIAMVGLTVFVVVLRDILLLVFAAVMVGVALTAAARAVQRATTLGHRLSLTIATTLSVGAIFGALWFIWPIFQEQLPTLFDRIMVTLGDIEDSIGVTLPENIQELTDSLTGFADQILAGLLSVFAAVASALSAFLLVIVAGVFLAAEPQRYRDGIVLLFPIS
jgi:predicted PurR-regulated permease PerM